MGGRKQVTSSQHAPGALTALERCGILDLILLTAKPSAQLNFSLKTLKFKTDENCAPTSPPKPFLRVRCLALGLGNPILHWFSSPRMRKMENVGRQCSRPSTLWGVSPGWAPQWWREGWRYQVCVTLYLLKFFSVFGSTYAQYIN